MFLCYIILTFKKYSFEFLTSKTGSKTMSLISVMSNHVITIITTYAYCKNSFTDCILIKFKLKKIYIYL